jgi:cell division protein FtsB
VLLVVLVVVLGLYIQQGIAYLSVHSQADEATAAAQRLSHANAQLRRQETRLNNPTTIAEEARQLGMIKPGERPYVVTGLPGG